MARLSQYRVTGYLDEVTRERFERVTTAPGPVQASANVYDALNLEGYSRALVIRAEQEGGEE